MLTDLPLFGYKPRARRSDPETSRLAAESMAPAAEIHCQRILQYLRRIGTINATKDEVGQAVGLDDVQAARRLSDLKDAGLVEDSGERRPSKSGHPCIAWRAK